MSLDKLLLQIFVYLTAAIISVPVARRLGLGSVTGYLIGGILIGPFALNLSKANAHSVMEITEFGVVMMLFVIGLELKPSLLWRLRRPIFGLGGAQVIVTALVIGGATMAFGQTWKVSLAIGLTLAMSSTALVLQSLSERGQLKTDAGQASFSVLLFQDIAVIPILAFLPMLAASPAAVAAHGMASPKGVGGALETIGVVVGIVVVGRFLTRPLFRFIAAARVREIFTAAALVLVMGIALLMNAVGLSPALGAFLGGVVLADSEYRHELESDIEPFKGILLGTFFVAVGASISFHVLAAAPWTIAGMVVGLMVLKALILGGLGGLFSLGKGGRSLLGVALAQGGEFAFVLLNMMVGDQVLPQDLAERLTAVVALSLLITPLGFAFYDKVIRPRLSAEKKSKHKQDTPEGGNPVVIAGFGRVGHLVGRMLKVYGIGATVIDLDHDQVELFRKLGVRVFYGDASRLDLLRAAGCEQAKVFVLAIDDEAKSVQIVEEVTQSFPHLKILARASGRLHAYEFLNRGITRVYRETLGCSMDMSSEVMRILGFRAYEAERAVRKLRYYDEQMVREMAELWKSSPSEDVYINAARQRTQALEHLFREDREGYDHPDPGWDNEQLRSHATEAEPSPTEKVP
jgi:monovalent cation:proton antiporter-2 (CPA2) family protein